MVKMPRPGARRCHMAPPLFYFAERVSLKISSRKYLPGDMFWILSASYEQGPSRAGTRTHKHKHEHTQSASDTRQDSTPGSIPASSTQHFKSLFAMDAVRARAKPKPKPKPLLRCGSTLRSSVRGQSRALAQEVNGPTRNQGYLSTAHLPEIASLRYRLRNK